MKLISSTSKQMVVMMAIFTAGWIIIKEGVVIKVLFIYYGNDFIWTTSTGEDKKKESIFKYSKECWWSSSSVARSEVKLSEVKWLHMREKGKVKGKEKGKGKWFLIVIYNRCWEVNLFFLFFEGERKSGRKYCVFLIRRVLNWILLTINYNDNDKYSLLLLDEWW